MDHNIQNLKERIKELTPKGSATLNHKKVGDQYRAAKKKIQNLKSTKIKFKQKLEEAVSNYDVAWTKFLDLQEQWNHLERELSDALSYGSGREPEEGAEPEDVSSGEADQNMEGEVYPSTPLNPAKRAKHSVRKSPPSQEPISPIPTRNRYGPLADSPQMKLIGAETQSFLMGTLTPK